MKYSTIFFDLDDTLVDTLSNNKEALEEMFIKYDFCKYFESFDLFYSRFQLRNNDLWDLYSQNKISKDTLKGERFKQTFEGVKSISLEESLRMNASFLESVSTKKNIIRGLIDVLDYLKPKYRLFILSNGFVEVQDHKMRNANIRSYFEKVILSEHIGINKPDSRIFIHALQEAGSTASESVMIGDNINTDITGAKNSGIDQIWFNPDGMADLQNIKPTYTVESLEELKSIL